MVWSISQSVESQEWDRVEVWIRVLVVLCNPTWRRSWVQHNYSHDQHKLQHVRNSWSPLLPTVSCLIITHNQNNIVSHSSWQFKSWWYDRPLSISLKLHNDVDVVILLELVPAVLDRMAKKSLTNCYSTSSRINNQTKPNPAFHPRTILSWVWCPQPFS